MPRPYRNRRPSLEPLERRNLLATLVTQPACLESDDCTLREYPDVNGDGSISPIDVLLLVNFINEHGVGAPAPENPPPFVDVNEDGVVTPGDALIVVNYLNGTPSEGESHSARVAPPNDALRSATEPLSRERLSRESMFSDSASTAIIEETELPITEILDKRHDEDCSDCQDGLAEDLDNELLADVLKTHSLADEINNFFGA
ncbi:MAG: hypothetical protein ACI9G1_005874 [Pirellulaceae bacterium]